MNRFTAEWIRRNPRLTDPSLRAALAPTAPSSSPATLEKEIHKSIVDYCEARGWVACHGAMHRPTFRTTGEPDFIILADYGRVFFVEVKLPGEDLSDGQREFHCQAAGLGHTVHMVFSFADFHKLVSPPL